MAKVIKKEGEEKYVQDIFLNMEEYRNLVKNQLGYGGNFKHPDFITIRDESEKIELSYFLSKEVYEILGVFEDRKMPFMKLSPLPEYGGKEELQKIKQIFDEAKISIEFTEGKCERCKEEKTVLIGCETCGMEVCPSCIAVDELGNNNLHTCYNCISEM